MSIILDGNKMVDKASTHNYLRARLDIPGYFGNNLDALWDALSTYDREMIIELKNKDCLVNNLGTYGISLIDLFTDAANGNQRIKFSII